MADDFETWLHQLNEAFVTSTTASLDVEEALTSVKRRADSDPSQNVHHGTEQPRNRVLVTDKDRESLGAIRSAADLLLAAATGDPAAWDEITRRYGRLVTTTVQSFRLHDADALDAVQMTWQRLADNADRVQFPERLGGWLATTARRECLLILRRTQRTSNPIDMVANTVADPSADPEQHLALVPGDRSMQWRALGPVEAIVEGRLVDLGPPRQRALFGLLLSRVDRPVAVHSVIEDLWAGHPPQVVMTAVRAYVANLRRLLEPHRPPRAPATVLRTRAPGYLLDSRGVDFDVHQFTEHAATGQAALGRADPAQALSELDAALGLWRGQPYADVADAHWAAPEVARLEELRLSVVEARCAAQLQLGERHGTVAELEMHVRAHPLREHGCELLALALYRAGRQAEALGMLRVTRARLAEQLGIDPGAALQRLEHDILTRAPALDWHPPTSTPVTFVGPAPPASPTHPAASARRCAFDGNGQ